MRSETSKSGKEWSIEFRDWQDLLTYVEKAEKLPLGHRSELASQYGAEKTSWSGTASFQQALDMARDGWADGETRMRKAFDAKVADVLTKVHKRDYYYAVEGEDIDVSAYAQGRPECWVSSDESRETKHVTIRLNCAVSAGISTDTIFARGAAVAVLCEALEYAGHRVQLQVVSCFSDDYVHSANMCVTVKDYDQPIDMHRLAFACAHNSMCRRLVFATMETAPENIRTALGSCYGYPRDGAWDKGADVYVGKALLNEYNWSDAGTVNAWILETLKSQGVELTD